MRSCPTVGGPPLRAAATSRPRISSGRPWMPRFCAMVLTVPPRRMAKAGSLSAPYARTSAVTVDRFVPSPPQAATTSTPAAAKRRAASASSPGVRVTTTSPAPAATRRSRSARPGERRTPSAFGLRTTASFMARQSRSGGSTAGPPAAGPRAPRCRRRARRRGRAPRRDAPSRKSAAPRRRSASRTKRASGSVPATARPSSAPASAKRSRAKSWRPSR